MRLHSPDRATMWGWAGPDAAPLASGGPCGVGRAPARFLGRTDDLGTVSVGRSADLVLSSGDPTADVANLHQVIGVVRAGRYRSPAELDELDELDEIRRRIATARSAG